MVHVTRSLPRLSSCALALSALFALASCDKGDKAGSLAQNGQAGAAVGALKAQPGGELVFAFDGAAVSQFALDPHKSLFAPHHRVIRSIFDSLVVALPDHRFGPWLAKRWQVSSDGREYTFELREDVKFHDGTRFDAEAVRFNLERIHDEKNALPARDDIGPYAGNEVLGEFSIKIRFSTPYAPLLANLSKSSLGIASPAAIQKYGDKFPLHRSGQDPFASSRSRREPRSFSRAMTNTAGKRRTMRIRALPFSSVSCSRTYRRKRRVWPSS